MNISRVEHFYEGDFHEIKKFLTCTSDGTLEKRYVLRAIVKLCVSVK